MRTLGDPRWQVPASAAQRARVLDRIGEDLAAGAIGIGLLMGYAPDVDPDEYLAVARLAAEAGVPTFTHSRDLVELRPSTVVDGAEELVRAAGETGAHMHHCHINSTSWRHIDRVLALVERCQNEGGRITTEAYPYGSSSTAIGAAFLAPERLHERGLAPSSLTYLPTGERVADAGRLAELRGLDPGGLVIIRLLDDDDPVDRATLRRSLQFRDAIVASDAMPVSAVGTPDPSAWSDWPLGSGFVTHPRTAGCFSRALRLWREEEVPLLEAVGRCTILPSRVLEACTPAMRTKARVQHGADADVVVFDPETITDQATYTATTRPSSGIRHVLVGGELVVRDGELLTDVLPGRAVRAVPA
jgi:N-acyl-D-aspartate/D-glutamate deacylase